MSPNRHQDCFALLYVISCSAAKRMLITRLYLALPCLAPSSLILGLVDMPLSPSSSSIEKLGDFSIDSPEKSKHGELCPEDVKQERDDDNDSEIKMAAPSGLTPVSFSAMFRSVVECLVPT